MFNIEDFDIKLDTEFVGRNFIYCEEIDSTNSWLLNNTTYDKNGTVLLSELQTKGRGRKERVWLSNKEQNLTFSILLKSNFKPTQLNIINLGTSLALAQALENLFQLKVDLKWPNDVLVNGHKIAGILLESVSKGNKISKVVVGVGINVNQPSFTGKFAIPPTSIKKETKETVNRERLLSEILNNFEEIFLLSENDSPKVISDWKSRCRMIGEKVKVVDDEDSRTGIFDDVDEDGFMILKKGDKLERIHFGDVSLR